MVAINKAMRAALKAISYMDLDVKKSYKAERALGGVVSKLHIKSSDYKSWDYAVVCGDHSVPVRMFTASDKPDGTLVFFHGGGWVTGNIDTYDRVCVEMAKQTGCKVVSVDYRLAPEYTFPTAPEDCYGVTREVFKGCLPDTRPESVTLIGDSAGGNLAAVVSLMARDRGEFMPQKQILIYPSTYYDHTGRSPFPSIASNGTDYLLTSKRICDFMELYKSSEEDFVNPYFAPLMASDFRNQPDTLLITAEFDPLRDEGEEYGHRLRDAGNKVEIHRVKDALHGFFSLPPRFAHVKEAYGQINRFLKGEGFIETSEALEKT